MGTSNSPTEPDPDEVIDRVAAWIGARLTLGRYDDHWPYMPERATAAKILAESEAWLLEHGLIRPTQACTITDPDILPVEGETFHVRPGVRQIQHYGRIIYLEPADVVRCSAGHRHILSMRPI